MSAASSIRGYSTAAINGAIRSLSYQHGTWPDRLTLLLSEKARREREERAASEPTQYHNRGCPTEP